VSINATLFVQAIVFAILVWFTMKFVWPPIANALDERAEKIAHGLKAAEHAHIELTNAHKHVEVELAKNRSEALRPWAIFSARSSSAFAMGGHTNFIVNHTKMANTIA